MSCRTAARRFGVAAETPITGTTSAGAQVAMLQKRRAADRGVCAYDLGATRGATGDHARQVATRPGSGERERGNLDITPPLRPAPNHAIEQDRASVLSQREAWFAGQFDLAPARLMFIDETPTATKIPAATAAADKAGGCG